jgi:hypothetical protein
MQAKRILNRSDLVDNRNWFITRFNEAVSTLGKMQASSIKKFDHKSIRNIREKLIDIRRDDSLNN